MTPRLARLACLALMLGPASDLTAATATLRCRGSLGVADRAICASPEYVAMDREIAALTDRAKVQLSQGERSQLAESTARYMRQRKGCGWAAHNSAHPGTAIDECVRASMETRVRRLRDVVERSAELSSR